MNRRRMAVNSTSKHFTGGAITGEELGEMKRCPERRMEVAATAAVAP
jgi:hypothetical protein